MEQGRKARSSERMGGYHLAAGRIGVVIGKREAAPRWEREKEQDDDERATLHLTSLERER